MSGPARGCGPRPGGLGSEDDDALGRTASSTRSGSARTRSSKVPSAEELSIGGTVSAAVEVVAFLQHSA